MSNPGDAIGPKEALDGTTVGDAKVKDSQNAEPPTPDVLSSDSVEAPSGEGHDARILQAMEAAAAGEASVSEEHQYGVLGEPINRRSPFYVGFSAAAGVSATLLLLATFYEARQVILLLGLALFIAAGLDPVVRWFHSRFMARWAAVAVVVLLALGILAGVVVLILPVLTKQITQLVASVPHYLNIANSHTSSIGKLNHRFHVESRFKTYLNNRFTNVAAGLLGLGQILLSAVVSIFIVVIISIYLLADLPRIKQTIYHLAPRSRRARAVLLGEEMFSKVGGYVLGNVVLSIIAGVGTWAWAQIFSIPYQLLLGTLVAILDLVPIAGSTIGGILVTLIALTVSGPIALGTGLFYLIYRLAEDYLLTPKVMGATVEVPALITIVATLVGGALLGVIGALVAIPVAAALKLLFEEITLPRLEQG